MQPAGQRDSLQRYRGPGPLVGQATARHILLEITDTGPGIPAEERQAVFERFHRLPFSRGRSGAGLGLSIVGKIAELYEAEISLADSTTGRGLRVSVRFPSASEMRGVTVDT